jgi:hypothetical protein
MFAKRYTSTDKGYVRRVALKEKTKYSIRIIFSRWGGFGFCAKI